MKRDPVYAFLQNAVRFAWRALGGSFHISGLDNVPAQGPFLLISNHQSVLDPILIQSACPRVVRTMTKSTQFAAPGMTFLLPRLYAFPVRRYQVDPQAVRFALRSLAQGEPVSIYIEGERSWDGVLQPARSGTVRLVLKAGVPVVPAAIVGSYDAWPRWASRFRTAPVKVSFGRPIRFPRLDRREDREQALPDATRRIMLAISHLCELSDGPAPAPRP